MVYVYHNWNQLWTLWERDLACLGLKAERYYLPPSNWLNWCLRLVQLAPWHEWPLRGGLRKILHLLAETVTVGKGNQLLLNGLEAQAAPVSLEREYREPTVPNAWPIRTRVFLRLPKWMCQLLWHWLMQLKSDLWAAESDTDLRGISKDLKTDILRVTFWNRLLDAAWAEHTKSHWLAKITYFPSKEAGPS